MPAQAAAYAYLDLFHLSMKKNLSKKNLWKRSYYVDSGESDFDSDDSYDSDPSTTEVSLATFAIDMQYWHKRMKKWLFSLNPRDSR